MRCTEVSSPSREVGRAAQPKPQPVWGSHLYGGDAVSDDVAKAADAQEAAQAEGHGRRIEATAVMEADVRSQRDRDGRSVGADLGGAAASRGSSSPSSERLYEEGSPKALSSWIVLTVLACAGSSELIFPAEATVNRWSARWG